MPVPKGTRVGGRKKGTPNKVTRLAHEAIDLAFEGIGGVQNLTEWGKANPGDFYKLWARRIPNAQEHSGKDGGPLAVTVRFAHE